MLNIHSLISDLFTLSILLGFGQLSQGESVVGRSTRDTLILEIFLIFSKLAPEVLLKHTTYLNHCREQIHLGLQTVKKAVSFRGVTYTHLLVGL